MDSSWSKALSKGSRRVFGRALSVRYSNESVPSGVLPCYRSVTSQNGLFVRVIIRTGHVRMPFEFGLWINLVMTMHGWPDMSFQSIQFCHSHPVSSAFFHQSCSHAGWPTVPVIPNIPRRNITEQDSSLFDPIVDMRPA